MVENGATEEPDGVARALGGVGRERFVYTERAGIWRTPVDIGMWVPKGFVVGRFDGLPVSAPLDGYVRGVARDAAAAPAGVKLLEIDPRRRAACWTGTDERGRQIAEAAMQAIRRHSARKKTPKAAGAKAVAAVARS